MLLSVLINYFFCEIVNWWCRDIVKSLEMGVVFECWDKNDDVEGRL